MFGNSFLWLPHSKSSANLNVVLLDHLLSSVGSPSSMGSTAWVNTSMPDTFLVANLRKLRPLNNFVNQNSTSSCLPAWLHVNSMSTKPDRPCIHVTYHHQADGRAIILWSLILKRSLLQLDEGTKRPFAQWLSNRMQLTTTLQHSPWHPQTREVVKESVMCICICSLEKGFKTSKWPSKSSRHRCNQLVRQLRFGLPAEALPEEHSTPVCCQLVDPQRNQRPRFYHHRMCNLEHLYNKIEMKLD